MRSNFLFSHFFYCKEIFIKKSKEKIALQKQKINNSLYEHKKKMFFDYLKEDSKKLEKLLFYWSKETTFPKFLKEVNEIKDKEINFLLYPVYNMTKNVKNIEILHKYDFPLSTNINNYTEIFTQSIDKKEFEIVLALLKSNKLNKSKNREFRLCYILWESIYANLDNNSDYIKNLTNILHEKNLLEENLAMIIKYHLYDFSYNSESFGQIIKELKNLTEVNPQLQEKIDCIRFISNYQILLEPAICDNFIKHLNSIAQSSESYVKKEKLEPLLAALESQKLKQEIDTVIAPLEIEKKSVSKI